MIRCVSPLAECRVRVHACKELYSYALLYNREVPYPLSLSRGKPRAILLYFIEDLKRKEAASILYRKAVGFLGPAHIAGDPDGSRLNCSFLHFRGTCSSHQGLGSPSPQRGPKCVRFANLCVNVEDGLLHGFKRP